MSRAVASVLALALFLPCAGAAQTTPAPSTEELIQQLKPSGRTRGSRNLIIESTPTQPGQPSATDGQGVDAAAPAAAQAPLPADDAPPATPPSVSLLIHFGFDSARVEAASRQALHNLAQAMLSPELASASFLIEGHTDAKGSADYNLKLSRRRAAAVLQELTQLGVDPARLTSEGKGFSEPANPQDPLDAANRRVRIVNLQ